MISVFCILYSARAQNMFLVISLALDNNEKNDNKNEWRNNKKVLRSAE